MACTKQESNNCGFHTAINCAFLACALPLLAHCGNDSQEALFKLRKHICLPELKTFDIRSNFDTLLLKTATLVDQIDSQQVLRHVHQPYFDTNQPLLRNLVIFRSDTLYPHYNIGFAIAGMSITIDGSVTPPDGLPSRSNKAVSFTPTKDTSCPAPPWDTKNHEASQPAFAPNNSTVRQKVSSPKGKPDCGKKTYQAINTNHIVTQALLSSPGQDSIFSFGDGEQAGSVQDCQSLPGITKHSEHPVSTPPFPAFGLPKHGAFISKLGQAVVAPNTDANPAPAVSPRPVSSKVQNLPATRLKVLPHDSSQREDPHKRSQLDGNTFTAQVTVISEAITHANPCHFRCLFEPQESSMVQPKTHLQPSLPFHATDNSNVLQQPLHIPNLLCITRCSLFPAQSALILEEFPDTYDRNDAMLFDKFVICCDTAPNHLRLLCVRIEQGQVQHILLVSPLQRTYSYVKNKITSAISCATQNQISFTWIKLASDFCAGQHAFSAFALAHKELKGKQLHGLHSISTSQIIHRDASTTYRLVSLSFVIGKKSGGQPNYQSQFNITVNCHKHVARNLESLRTSDFEGSTGSLIIWNSSESKLSDVQKQLSSVSRKVSTNSDRLKRMSFSKSHIPGTRRFFCSLLLHSREESVHFLPILKKENDDCVLAISLRTPTCQTEDEQGLVFLHCDFDTLDKFNTLVCSHTSSKPIIVSLTPSCHACSIVDPYKWCTLAQQALTIDPMPELLPLKFSVASPPTSPDNQPHYAILVHKHACRVELPFMTWPISFQAVCQTTDFISDQSIIEAIEKTAKCDIVAFKEKKPDQKQEMEQSDLTTITWQTPANQAQLLLQFVHAQRQMPINVGNSTVLLTITIYHGMTPSVSARKKDPTTFMDMVANTVKSAIQVPVLAHVAFPSIVAISISDSVDNVKPLTRLSPSNLLVSSRAQFNDLLCAPGLFHPQSYLHAQLPKGTLVVAKLNFPDEMLNLAQIDSSKVIQTLLYDHTKELADNHYTAGHREEYQMDCQMVNTQSTLTFWFSENLPVFFLIDSSCRLTVQWKDQKNNDVDLSINTVQASVVVFAPPKWIHSQHRHEYLPNVFNLQCRCTRGNGSRIVIISQCKPNSSPIDQPHHENPIFRPEKKVVYSETRVDKDAHQDNLARPSSEPDWSPMFCKNFSLDLCTLVKTAYHDFHTDIKIAIPELARHLQDMLNRLASSPMHFGQPSQTIMQSLTLSLTDNIASSPSKPELLRNIFFIDIPDDELQIANEDCLSIHQQLSGTLSELECMMACTMLVNAMAQLPNIVTNAESAGLPKEESKWHLTHLVSLAFFSAIQHSGYPGTFAKFCPTPIRTETCLGPMWKEAFNLGASNLTHPTDGCFCDNDQSVKTDTDTKEHLHKSSIIFYMCAKICLLLDPGTKNRQVDKDSQDNSNPMDIDDIDDTSKGYEQINISSDAKDLNEDVFPSRISGDSLPPSPSINETHPNKRPLFLWSLFDGLGCARLGVKRYLEHHNMLNHLAGAVIAEIDKTAIKASLNVWGPDSPSFENPIPLVFYDVWHLIHLKLIPLAQVLAQHPFGSVILIIAGSPCQDFTFAGPFRGNLGLAGPSSVMFFSVCLLLYAIHELRPDIDIVYMFENAGSMHLKFRHAIQDILSLPNQSFLPVIDTFEFSAFRRKRIFPSNLPWKNGSPKTEVSHKDHMDCDNPFMQHQADEFEDDWTPCTTPLPPMMRARPKHTEDNLCPQKQALRSLYQYHPKHLLRHDCAPLDLGAYLLTQELHNEHAGFIAVQQGNKAQACDHSEASRKATIEWEKKVRPFALWIEHHGRSVGLRTPSGKERLKAMSLNIYDQANSLTESELLDLTGNTFHPNVIAARLHADGVSSLANVLLSPPHTILNPKFLNPANLWNKFDDIRQDVCLDPTLTPFTVDKPFHESYLWAPAIIADAALHAKPGANGAVLCSTGLTYGHQTAVPSIDLKNIRDVILLGGPAWKQCRKIWQNRHIQLIATCSVKGQHRSSWKSTKFTHCSSPGAVLKVIHAELTHKTSSRTTQVHEDDITTWQARTSQESMPVNQAPDTPITPASSFCRHRTAMQEIWGQLNIEHGEVYNLWALHTYSTALPVCISEGTREFLFEYDDKRPWALIAFAFEQGHPTFTAFLTQNKVHSCLIPAQDIPLQQFPQAAVTISIVLTKSPVANWVRIHGCIPTHSKHDLPGTLCGDLQHILTTLEDSETARCCIQDYLSRHEQRSIAYLCGDLAGRAVSIQELLSAHSIPLGQTYGIVTHNLSNDTFCYQVICTKKLDHRMSEHSTMHEPSWSEMEHGHDLWPRKIVFIQVGISSMSVFTCVCLHPNTAGTTACFHRKNIKWNIHDPDKSSPSHAAPASVRSAPEPVQKSIRLRSRSPKLSPPSTDDKTSNSSPPIPSKHHAVVR